MPGWEDLFNAMFSHGHAPVPKSNDPHDFPRSARITDDDALMLIAQIDRHTEEYTVLYEQMTTLQERLMIIKAERDIACTKLFQRLRAAYPHVQARQPVGWRKHDNEFWYVGWDAVAE